MTAHIDDISHMRLCERCRRWGPEEANFCGHCGFQLRPIPFPCAATAAEVAAQAHRRRRRRRLLAIDNAGWAGLIGTLIGERIHDSRTAERREE